MEYSLASRNHTEQNPQQVSSNATEDKGAQAPTIDTQVHNILELTDGWNGFGSHRVDRNSLTVLLDILAGLDCSPQPPPQIVPLSSGGVQVEWHNLTNSIEIGVDVNRNISVFATNQDNYELSIEHEQQLKDDIVRRLASLLRLHGTD